MGLLQNLSTRFKRFNADDSLEQVSIGFVGSTIHEADCPIFAQLLKLTSNRASRREELISFVTSSSPRLLFALRDELRSLSIPGEALYSFDEHEDAFAFSEDAFRDFFVAQGFRGSESFKKFSLMLLAFICEYIAALPPRLGHAPSLARLAQSAEIIGQYSDGVNSAGKDLSEECLRQCRKELAWIFEDNNRGRLSRISTADAFEICSLARLNVRSSPLEALSVLYDHVLTHFRLLDKSAILNTNEDDGVRNKCASDAYGSVFVRGIFPTRAMNMVRTYAGEETNS